MSSNPELLTINLKRSQRSKYNRENNNINTEQDNIIEVENENERNAKAKNRAMKIDNFAENNITARSIIDNALFSQLSVINVQLLDVDESLSQRLFNLEGKILPKIDLIEFTLLNQKVGISDLKKYGFGLYVFFLYLISLLVTFGVLFIFAFSYMY